MSQHLKIGLLSDSHLKTELHREAIEQLLKMGVEYFLHAGDIMLEKHLQMLEDTNLPYVSVFGNNDTALIPLYGEYNIYQEPYYFKIDNLKIKIMHHPYYMTPDADLIVSGHTHMFEATQTKGTLFINPGEVCARDKPLTECAMVEVKDGVFEVTHFFRELNSKEWKVRKV